MAFMKSHGIKFYSQLAHCVKEAFLPFQAKHAASVAKNAMWVREPPTGN